MNRFYITLALIITLANSALAQNPPDAKNNNSEPVEISADHSLEWLQNQKQYVANGNVEAKKGDMTILADKLIADYKDDNQSSNVQIWQLTAEGNVQLKNTNSTATGDKAVYNVDTGLATLTGKNLKLTTPDQVITAEKSMEYNTVQGVAKAIGNAKILKEQDTLMSDTITANFIKDKNGNQVLKSATANGSVTIKTPDETITGDSGNYYADSNTAELLGNVKIVRGPNMLEGARAEIDLTTNVSKMFGTPETGKRVKGIFYPGSNKAPNKAP